jgi:hypothetical protein
MLAPLCPLGPAASNKRMKSYDGKCNVLSISFEKFEKYEPFKVIEQLELLELLVYSAVCWHKTVVRH